MPNTHRTGGIYLIQIYSIEDIKPVEPQQQVNPLRDAGIFGQRSRELPDAFLISANAALVYAVNGKPLCTIVVPLRDQQPVR